MRKMAKKNLIKVKGKNWKRGGRMSRKELYCERATKSAKKKQWEFDGIKKWKRKSVGRMKQLVCL